ncbi:class I SAM-dependent methyltransferase [Haloparvum sedimenti]|uniref:class I SAM-dependent methyltransferase n=1 Tax=Haloparvum sedimenti TaxID=1678448 RepID=UPI00071E8491|nr:class I SAM-dependent methyltransferase [Haloparvum sedimenti]
MNENDVLASWADRAGEYSPDYYAHYGADERSERVRAHLAERVDADAAVLEVGCSAGRHLEHLREAGYADLHGIEINETAFDVMADEYPDLFAAGTFHAAAVEDVLPDVEDDRYGAVFSVETLQHVHPDNAWVFDDLVRVAKDLIVTVEIEKGEGGGPSPSADTADDANVNYVDDDVPLYYRDWASVLGDRGCEQIAAETVGNDTLRAFEPPAADD